MRRGLIPAVTAPVVATAVIVAWTSGYAAPLLYGLRQWAGAWRGVTFRGILFRRNATRAQ
jgi:hypothetical protein